MKRAVAAVLAGLALIGGLAACSSKADVASQNLSTEADNFQIMRQVVFYR